MREIKFRVWVPTFKAFMDTGGLVMGLTGKVFEDDCGIIHPSYLSDATLQQFTGLKDKNGKDIYEGDIIGKSEVVFHEGAFYLSVKGGALILLSDLECPEVVGNVHENPELCTT